MAEIDYDKLAVAIVRAQLIAPDALIDEEVEQWPPELARRVPPLGEEGVTQTQRIEVWRQLRREAINVMEAVAELKQKEEARIAEIKEREAGEVKRTLAQNAEEWAASQQYYHALCQTRAAQGRPQPAPPERPPLTEAELEAARKPVDYRM